jgi:hypothetical protein
MNDFKNSYSYRAGYVEGYADAYKEIAKLPSLLSGHKGEAKRLLIQLRRGGKKDK